MRERIPTSEDRSADDSTYKPSESEKAADKLREEVLGSNMLTGGCILDVPQETTRELADRYLRGAWPPPSVMEQNCRTLAKELADIGLKDWMVPIYPAQQPDFLNRAMQVKQINQMVAKYGSLIDTLNRTGGDFSSQALENLPNGWTKIQDENGKVTIKPALPLDSQDNPENQKKLIAATTWLEKYAPEVDRALVHAEEEPLSIGDRKVAGVTANGQKYDLVTQKYHAEACPDGTIKVVSESDYQQRSWYSYNNWLTDSVGTTESTKIYKPEELVPVKNSFGDTVLVMAKNLSSYEVCGKVAHHGLKVAGLLADVGMFASGAVAGRAAWAAGSKTLAAWNYFNAGLAAAGAAEPLMSEEANHYRHYAMLPGLLTSAVGGYVSSGLSRAASAGSELMPKASAWLKGSVETAEAVDKVVSSSRLANAGHRSMQASLGMFGPYDGLQVGNMAYRNYRGGWSGHLLDSATSRHGRQPVLIPVVQRGLHKWYENDMVWNNNR